MKGDVLPDHFLMLWFQKDSLNTFGFRTFRTFTTFKGGVCKASVERQLGKLDKASKPVLGDGAPPS